MTTNPARAFFDDAGSLTLSGMTLSGVLAALSRLMESFLLAVETCEREGEGFRIRDSKAGNPGGLRQQWFDVVALACTATAATLPDLPGKAKAARDDGAVVKAIQSPMREFAPLADTLKRLTFALPMAPDGKWVATITDADLSRIRAMRRVVDDVRGALPTAPADSPNALHGELHRIHEVLGIHPDYWCQRTPDFAEGLNANVVNALAIAAGARLGVFDVTEKPARPGEGSKPKRILIVHSPEGSVPPLPLVLWEWPAVTDSIVPSAEAIRARLKTWMEWAARVAATEPRAHTDRAARANAGAAPRKPKPIPDYLQQAAESREKLTAARDDLIPETGRKPTMRAYEWVSAHFYDGKPPSYHSWCRYLRKFDAWGEPAKSRKAGERATEARSARKSRGDRAG